MVAVVLAAALCCGLLQAQAQSFQTTAPFALLMDYESGAVLFEKNADELMGPASNSKLMTAEIVFRELKEGRLKLDDQFEVSENAWRTGGAPSRGSKMFLAVRSNVRDRGPPARSRHRFRQRRCDHARRGRRGDGGQFRRDDEQTRR